MKLSNTVVTAIIIVATLVSAYALGLLIRQARTGRVRVQTPAEVNNVARQTEVSSHRPGEERTQDTPEERAKIKDQKAQAIKKMNAMTPEEKQKFREQIRKQVGGRQPGKEPKGVSSAPQGEKAKEQGQAEAGDRKENTDVATPSGDNTTPKPSAEKAGAEAGQAGPG